jgi:hypothetical protein
MHVRPRHLVIVLARPKAHVALLNKHVALIVAANNRKHSVHIDPGDSEQIQTTIESDVAAFVPMLLAVYFRYLEFSL